MVTQGVRIEEVLGMWAWIGCFAREKCTLGSGSKSRN